MITDPNNPADWLLLARDRLEKADALFERFGSSWTGIELLHEAAERFLKAYLIHQRWELIKTHDLSRLLAEACGFDLRFERFSETTLLLTEQFWEPLVASFYERRCQRTARSIRRHHTPVVQADVESLKSAKLSPKGISSASTIECRGSKIQRATASWSQYIRIVLKSNSAINSRLKKSSIFLLFPAFAVKFIHIHMDWLYSPVGSCQIPNQ